MTIAQTARQPTLLEAQPQLYVTDLGAALAFYCDKLGFLKAVVYFALKRPDLADKFAEYLQTLGLEASTKR